MQFYEWYRCDHEKRMKHLKEKADAKPAMTMRQYIEQLRTLDPQDIQSLDHFAGVTSSGGIYEKPCDPIILGSENGIRYQFRSGTLQYAGELDIPENVKDIHELFWEIKATAEGEEPPIKFVMVLGTLRHVNEGFEKHPELCKYYPHKAEVETPYYVVLNVIDKSLWLVLAPYYTDDIYVDHEISMEQDTWAFLNTHSNGRGSFDIMRIATWDEFSKFNTDPHKAKRRRLFNFSSMWTAQRIAPKLFAADFFEIYLALEDSTDLRVLGSEERHYTLDNTDVMGYAGLLVTLLFGAFNRLMDLVQPRSGRLTDFDEKTGLVENIKVSIEPDEIPQLEEKQKLKEIKQQISQDSDTVAAESQDNASTEPSVGEEDKADSTSESDLQLDVQKSTEATAECQVKIEKTGKGTTPSRRPILQKEFHSSPNFSSNYPHTYRRAITGTC